jgi:hypothetical protein
MQNGSISSLLVAIVLQGGAYGLAGALIGGLISILMQWSAKEGMKSGLGLGFLLGAVCALHVFFDLPAS